MDDPEVVRVSEVHVLLGGGCELVNHLELGVQFEFFVQVKLIARHDALTEQQLQVGRSEPLVRSGLYLLKLVTQIVVYLSQLDLEHQDVEGCHQTDCQVAQPHEVGQSVGSWALSLH